MKFCHECGAEWVEKHEPGRLETCMSCRADMHCCLNCAEYDTSKSRNCAVPQSDPPSDKARWNDCEYFKLADKDAPNTDKSASPERKEDLKKKWDSLFKPGTY